MEANGKEMGRNGTKIDRITATQHVETQPKERIDMLCDKWNHLFAKDPNKPPTTLKFEHTIDTQGHVPVNCKPYRASPMARQHIRKLTKEMLSNGIISYSRSPWAFPVVLVPKKSGDMRFCIDYRKLNAVTKRDVYPLPRIDDLLDSLGNSKFFTTLDLASEYWQFPIAPRKPREDIVYHPGRTL